MSDKVHIVKAVDIKESGGQTQGMIRQNAIVMSPRRYAHQSSSAVHHHGEQGEPVMPHNLAMRRSFFGVRDTIVYAAKGHGTVVSEGGKKRQDLSPGDFALIPAFAEHQEVNDGEEDVTWIITRSGKSPVVQNLEGWGKT